MTTQPRKYRTRQREAIAAYLACNTDRYLSVDDVWAATTSDGKGIGRSTAYRCLESMVQEGTAFKATSPGGEAWYRLATDSQSGQLVCLSCGRAYPLDCHMVSEFAGHVLADHGFRIDPTRTVLYGTCQACMRSES